MGLKDLLSNFFNTEHPIYIAFLMGSIVCLISFIFIKYILIPLRKRHKFEMEFKQAKLMALFAEANPNPLFRVDANGIITNHNETAKNLFNKDIIIGESVYNIIDESNLDIGELISGDKDFTFSRKINDKYYSIYLKGIKDLNIGLVYLHDITFRYKYEENLRSFYDRLHDNIEEERKRISYELHDDIGQQITFAKFLINNGKPVEEIFNVLDSAKDDLRHIARNLRPRILEQEGVKSALTVLCEAIIKETGIKGICTFELKENRFDEKKELLIYRLAQESLSNIIKHSKATQFTISLCGDENKIILNITDDGVGIENLEMLKNNYTSKGLGLLNMKERAELMGGNFDILSAPGNGTKVIFEIPNR